MRSLKISNLYHHIQNAFLRSIYNVRIYFSIIVPFTFQSHQEKGMQGKVISFNQNQLSLSLSIVSKNSALKKNIDEVLANEKSY